MCDQKFIAVMFLCSHALFIQPVSTKHFTLIASLLPIFGSLKLGVNVTDLRLHEHTYMKS